MGASRQAQRRAPAYEQPDVPAELTRQFARYRRDRRRGSRVPAELRAAVLRALDQGVERESLQRALSLSAQQVEAWQEGAAGRADRGGVARIFEVTDAPARGEPGSTLELRVGDLSIVIRSMRAE